MRRPMKSMIRVFLVAFLAIALGFGLGVMATSPAQAGTVTITLGSGLDEDGFLTNNATFGNLWNSYTRTVECILVGTDTPGGSGAVFRAYQRYPLSGITGQVVKATLYNYLYEVNSPTTDAVLGDIDDFGTLSWGGSTSSPDWNLTWHGNVYGVHTTTPTGWVAIDVTTYINTAIAASATHKAFEWKYADELGVALGRFYSFVSGNAASLRPYLQVIELTAPADLVALFSPSGAAHLSWTGTTSDEEDGFKVERSPDGGSTWTQIGTVGAGVNSYNDVPRPGYNIYRVRAYKDTYNSGYATWTGTMGMILP